MTSLAECIRSQSTLHCRASTVFLVCLDAVALPWFLLGLSANCPALPRVIWPKYCSFSFATLPINSLSRPNFVNIESFVLCSCHEMLSIFLQHHISKASILFLSDFFKVHRSTPYWNTCHYALHKSTFALLLYFNSLLLLPSVFIQPTYLCTHHKLGWLRHQPNKRLDIAGTFYEPNKQHQGTDRNYKKNNIQEIKSISSSLFHNHMMQHIYALLYVMQKRF